MRSHLASALIIALEKPSLMGCFWFRIRVVRSSSLPFHLLTSPCGHWIDRSTIDGARSVKFCGDLRETGLDPRDILVNALAVPKKRTFVCVKGGNQVTAVGRVESKNMVLEA